MCITMHVCTVQGYTFFCRLQKYSHFLKFAICLMYTEEPTAERAHNNLRRNTTNVVYQSAPILAQTTPHFLSNPGGLNGQHHSKA